MIPLLSYPIINVPFQVGVRGGKTTAGEIQDTVSSGSDFFFDFSRRLRNNALFLAGFTLVVLVLVMKIINRVTK